MENKELKVKNGELIKYLPLEVMGDIYRFNAHNNGAKIKYNNKFDYVMCSIRNSEIIENYPCPFCEHPNDNVRKLRIVRFPIVYTKLSPMSEQINQINWADLKFSIWNRLYNWEVIEKKSIQNRLITVFRTGRGLYDTQYKVTVGTEEKIVLTEREISTIQEIRDWLRNKYVVDREQMKWIYYSALIDGKPPDYYGITFKDGDTF